MEYAKARKKINRRIAKAKVKLQLLRLAASSRGGVGWWLSEAASHYGPSYTLPGMGPRGPGGAPWAEVGLTEVGL